MGQTIMPMLLALGAGGVLLATYFVDVFGRSSSMGGLGPATVPRALLAVVLILGAVDAVKGGKVLLATRRRGERLTKYSSAVQTKRALGLVLVVLSALVLTYLITEVDLVLGVVAVLLGWMLLLGVRRPVTLALAAASATVLVLVIVIITKAPVTRLTL